ncbi:MAG: hypothetical protein M9897_00030 [Brumimicrobium sp.]|nr:hypothetical protein [Brumimicrobium sp.]
MKQVRQLSLLSSSLCLVLILFASCKKDKIPNMAVNNGNNETIPCEDFNWGEGNITLDEYYGDTTYSQPCFSPFTDDEFVYIRGGVASSAELVKHIISTGEDIVLCNANETIGLGISQPDWGRQGKIVFNVGTGSSGIGYIINDDGSDLHQFLPSNVNFSQPKFDNEGKEIFALGSYYNSESNILSPIYDLNANIVDSFICYFNGTIGIGSPACFDGKIKNGLFAFADLTQTPAEKGLGYIISDTIFSPIISTNNPDGYALTDVDKYQNYIYYVIYGLGFYQYNELTGSTKLLQEMCQTREILNISVSQISGNILIEEIHNSKLSESGGVLIQPNIYLLNPNTMKKTPILVKK